MLCEELRRQVLKVAQSLPAYGLVWMAGGTVCARDPESGYVVVTPSGMPYDSLTPEGMIVTTIDERVVEGDYRPSVALNLWTAIFRARPEIHALVHTHSPCATAFSLTGDPIPVVTETMADWFGQPVPVAPYFHVEDPRFVSEPVKVLGSGFAVLLGKHGPITIGRTLAHALERAVTLEESAKIYIMARTIGQPLPLTATEAARSFEYYAHRYGQKPVVSA